MNIPRTYSIKDVALALEINYHSLHNLVFERQYLPKPTVQRYEGAKRLHYSEADLTELRRGLRKLRENKLVRI